jgi:cytochrome b6-f complex iron-sulfur subunit
MKLDESYVARRRFLCCMLGGGAAVMGAGMVTPLVQYAGNLHPSPPPDFLALERDEYELAPGKGKMILYGHIPTLLLQPADTGKPLLAFVATCTHLNCTVTYQEVQNRIFCACHEGSFDLEGRVIAGPPPSPLQRFFTKLNNGKLILALEEANLAKAT